jgi:hypothetical protein
LHPYDKDGTEHREFYIKTKDEIKYYETWEMKRTGSRITFTRKMSSREVHPEEEEEELPDDNEDETDERTEEE